MESRPSTYREPIKLYRDCTEDILPFFDREVREGVIFAAFAGMLWTRRLFGFHVSNVSLLNAILDEFKLSKHL